METFQVNTPQKTSFWDFRHKKAYLNRKEKTADLLLGIILGLIPVGILIEVTLYTFSSWDICQYRWFCNFLEKNINVIFGLILGLCVAFCIYMFLKRKYIFLSFLITNLVFIAAYILLNIYLSTIF